MRGEKMLHTKRIEVTLTEEEMKFVKWMAKRDGVSVQEELWMFFHTEFEQCKTLYLDEMKQEENNDGEGTDAEPTSGSWHITI